MMAEKVFLCFIIVYGGFWKGLLFYLRIVRFFLLVFYMFGVFVYLNLCNRLYCLCDEKIHKNDRIVFVGCVISSVFLKTIIAKPFCSGN